MSIDKMRVRDVICARELWEAAMRRGCVCWGEWGKEGDRVWHGLG